MKIAFLVSLLFILTACFKGKKVDMIIHNAKIHTMDENNSIAEAMAIQNGKIVELGPERQILNKYRADETIDAAGRDVFPGLADAHAHMMSLARMKLAANLFGCSSMEDLLVRLEKYDQKHTYKQLVGYGWNEQLWLKQELPTNAEISKLFPVKPVVLYRVDGHAALLNNAALKLCGFTKQTQVEGGALIKNEQGELTGVVLDNVLELVKNKLPDFNQLEIEKALVEIQQELFAFGITDVHEAGLSYQDFKLLDKLVSQRKIELGIYGMLYPTVANIAFAKKNGKYRNKNLSVRSFKVMADGALGSHGAYLKQDYSDMPGNRGLLTTSVQELNRVSKLCELTGYQMNTHAIGDSTNRLILELILGYVTKNPDHRWRIEHAQVLDWNDLTLLNKSGAFPSVQPTHAISDCGWAKVRLGDKRMKGAYAYKSILAFSQMGMIALGTDFPVEQLNPFLTIQAAVNRMDAENGPLGGFQTSEALDVTSCMKGMTIWPAFASFQEETKGSLELGKDATFVVLENPFKVTGNFVSNYSHLTVIKGKKVFGDL